MKTAWIVGLFFEALLFGVFVMTYLKGLSLLLRKDRPSEFKRKNQILLGASSVMFVVSAAVSGPRSLLLWPRAISPFSCSIFASLSSLRCTGLSIKETRWRTRSTTVPIRLLPQLQALPRSSSTSRKG